MPPHDERPPRSRLKRTLIGSLLLLFITPPALGLLADRLGRWSSEALRGCEDGVPLARWADWLHRLEGLSPLSSSHAREGRAALIQRVQNGLMVCTHRGAPPTALFAEGERLLIELLPQIITEPEADYGPRHAVEELLHERGRDRAILELARRLPAGGNVLYRVTAHLYLGDLAGAAETWRAPGATLEGFRPGFVLERAAVLCMAGDPAGLEAFEPEPERPTRAMRAHAECLLRQGRLEALERLTEAPGWRAELAIARGDLGEARRRSAMIEHPSPEDHLRDFWLAVKAGAAPEPLREMGLSGYLSSRRFEPSASLYNTIYWPPLHEGRLREVAEALEGIDALHDLAARARLVEAVYQGRRWDPRLEATLARAEALAPGWDRPDLIRAAFDWFHGDWARFDARPPSPWLRSLREARAALLGGPLGPPHDDPRHLNLVLGVLNPGEGLPMSIARLMRSPLTTAQRWSVLKEQPQQAPLTSHFCRLSLQVTFGRLLGVDVSAARAQLEALRAMYDAQPNPRLLMGAAHHPYGEAL